MASRHVSHWLWNRDVERTWFVGIVALPVTRCSGDDGVNPAEVGSSNAANGGEGRGAHQFRFTGMTGAAGRSRLWDGRKVKIALGLAPGILLVDLATKLVVQNSLTPYQHVGIIGDAFRLTYIYNPGAAFGLSFGEHTREILAAASTLVLIALSILYWRTPVQDRVRQVSIALVCGGAMGNLLDRIRSPLGVIDFLDVGLGALRWPTFNVADVAVATGAILLAASFWNEGKQVGDGSASRR